MNKLLATCIILHLCIPTTKNVYKFCGMCQQLIECNLENELGMYDSL